ncbi:uncharacterized protein LOC124137598 isoform X1 [Haliotis rufescens]|uniref:uncharacterized protein LOC124137598 isoform X1 n=1 Tax=Haliotis rufescens TaxID=6454 RepID=UPI00201EDCC8|nr:uncharacterized protein LOC124137598 isoform X1 [Haliotis rufescens]XP_046359929.2 uncharacterized protein LOC124137598 isoform X1 [Haliotis rufescens]XP_048254889.1 uncharacterized protein LOC124137598 isoform X1 [Haliotis rufescens]
MKTLPPLDLAGVSPSRSTSSHSSEAIPTHKNVNVSDLVEQPRPSPSNSEELVQNGAQRTTTCHVNTEDTGIGLQDMKLNDHFLNQFEPSVQSKLKMITAAHQNAKKYLDITVTALKNQKQYLKYMSEQNKEYQVKLESLELELRREQALKDKAERDTHMWKAQCNKAEATFNKVQSRKTQIQVSLAQMYDKYDSLMSENQSLRRLVENLSSSGEEKRLCLMPARKPKQAPPRTVPAEARSDTMVRLPPIAKSSRSRALNKTKRPGQTSLPLIEQDRLNLQGDIETATSLNQSPYRSAVRTPTPWHKGSENSNNSCMGERWYQ